MLALLGERRIPSKLKSVVLFFSASFFGVTPQLTFYFNIHAGPGEAITQLVLSSTSQQCCFETDNYSAIPIGVPGPIAGAGPAGSDRGERWPSRPVATAAAEDGLNR
jgi:hypothetical protein